MRYGLLNDATAKIAAILAIHLRIEDELLLPYSFDLSVYSHIDNPGLLEHIDRVGVDLYIKD